MAIHTLGIETSCDETAAAVVREGRVVLSNVVASQVPLHVRFGGVVPEVASRAHLESIVGVVEAALAEAGVSLDQVDQVAVTRGPGLVGSLLVGLCFGKSLAYGRGLPLVAVHHLLAHVYANFLVEDPPEFPFVCLVVSGGHTDLVRVIDHGRWEILGRTRDDAAGEALDKVGRLMGLDYPAGPAIDRLSAGGNRRAISFPRAKLEPGSLDFSFSGLKTAAARFLSQWTREGGASLADVAASFQEAVVEVLVEKAIAACRLTGTPRLAGAGGVTANRRLRALLRERCTREGISLYLPPVALCTDNAAMVASLGYYMWRLGKTSSWDVEASPNLGWEEGPT